MRIIKIYKIFYHIEYHQKLILVIEISTEMVYYLIMQFNKYQQSTKIINYSIMIFINEEHDAFTCN